MIKIGEFSKLVQVPVATLRYYDQIGLLKPIEVDRYTGYRYYQMDQLPRLNRILALKDLGFAMGFGKEFGVPLELAALAYQTFTKGKAAYGGNAQSTQIVKLLEDALGTELRAPGFPARLE